MSANPPLADRLTWLELAGCTCEWRFGPQGRLDGVSLGHGWSRASTDPDCPHHAERKAHG